MNMQQLEKFCENNNIVVNTFQKAAELLNDPAIEKLAYEDKGIALYSKTHDIKSIYYNDNLPTEEKYHTLAHEIGHHVLEHMATREHQSTAAETEADVFASVLMALSVFAGMAVTI